jgi:transaldolase
MTNLHTLYNNFSVSPWLDNLSRELIISGELQTLVDKGIRGLTSNPSIFEKAFSDGIYYAEPLKLLTDSGKSIEEAYWELAIKDIQDACDILTPVFRESDGNDGFVSLEVSPELAHDCSATVTQAKDLWARVNRPNLMIKIPATPECVPAISEVLAAGINVNVTLIFSLHRYLQVIAAYFDGLERLSDPSRVRSVASFFISRVDTEVDPGLEKLQDHGVAAVAQARAAYGIFLQSFNVNAERWSALEVRGAVAQRPLWASTSTKDPSFPDLKYVDGLLAHSTVNTLPNATVEAILDHAKLDDKLPLSAEDIENAHEDLAKLKVSGVDMRTVSEKLEKEGVEKFQQAFKNMLAALK